MIRIDKLPVLLGGICQISAERIGLVKLFSMREESGMSKLSVGQSRNHPKFCRNVQDCKMFNEVGWIGQNFCQSQQNWSLWEGVDGFFKISV